MTLKIYIAGPEVFLPNGLEIVERKRALCRDYGFEPSARQGDFLKHAGGDKFTFGVLISGHNEALMRESDIVVANLTPFRGISADPGTVYELGFMCALDRPAFAYTNTARGYHERVVNDYYRGNVTAGVNGRQAGSDGHMIEDHDMVDNLMLDGGIDRLGGFVVRHKAPAGGEFTDLSGYEQCLSRIRDGGWAERLA